MTDSSTPVPRQRGGDQPVSIFEEELGLPSSFSSRSGGESDPELLRAIAWMENERPPQQNFWPALTLAFVAQCEEALSLVGRENDADPFTNFPVEESTSRRVVNTLNFIVNGKKVALRPAFNRAAPVIRIEMRRTHPSAAPHATQAWPDYRELIGYIFRMTPAGRARFVEYIWRTGVVAAAERRWATQAERIVRPFEKVLADFSTQNARPGGALFQGLVFGYFRADSPNLTLESHKVNTGSSRADMPGDVAGFRGGEVELAVEVKDSVITQDIVENLLVDFLEDLVEAPNTTAVVVADSVDNASRDRLRESNVIAISRQEMRERVVTWDLPKQQEALRGMIYYLGRIQKSPALVERLVEFLEENGIASGIVDQPIIRHSDDD